MDASQSFTNLIRSIEESNLNYSMSRTPFSATISLKCSFVKRFTEVFPTDVKSLSLSLNAVKLLEKNMKNLESENLELKSKVKELENSAYLEQEAVAKLKQAFDNEKENSEDSENKIVEFREELLKIKREKHDLSLDLKAQKETFKALKEECIVLKRENKSVNKMLKDKEKLFDDKQVELNNVRKEVQSKKQALEQVKIELVQSKLQEQREIRTEIKCNECATSVQSNDQLKLHIRQYHRHNKFSQYETPCSFEKYQCFYCDKSITSKDDLEAHTIVCSEMLNILLQPVSPIHQEVDVFHCDQCGEECTNFEDLGRHMATGHRTSLEDPGGGNFWCDICPLYFESNCDLQFHKRGCHWDQI
jgi:myosin heavy subunit